MAPPVGQPYIHGRASEPQDPKAHHAGQPARLRRPWPGRRAAAEGGHRFRAWRIAAVVQFEEFERRAREEWERIPAEYKAGVDVLIVDRQAKPHPRTRDIYTLGECVTEAYPSDFGGPDTVRSAVVLYYGSFLRLSRLDSSFDWAEEIWETLTHELKHHLESLAAEDALTDVDYAMDENYKRQEEEPFDPFFFRAGEPLGDGVYRLERSVFVERPPPPSGERITFVVDDVAYSAAPPELRADVMFITLTGDVDPELDELCLVVVGRPGLGGRLRSLLGRGTPAVVQLEAAAERVRE